MQLKDIMTKNVKILPQNASVRDAARLMKEIDSGFIPIMENNRVIGTLTDRDIVLRSTAEGRDPNDTRVQDVMTNEFYFCYDDDDVQKAAKLMSEKQIRRIPIINHDHELVGVVALGDLAVENRNDKMSGDTLEDISKPSKPRM